MNDFAGSLIGSTHTKRNVRPGSNGYWAKLAAVAGGSRTLTTTP